MWLHFGSALAVWLATAGPAAARETTGVKEVRNIAIIGAGAAGSSAALHLREFADEDGVAVNITLFEKTDHVGGRTLTVNAFGDPLQAIELGASIFVTINHILYNATKTFDLPLNELKTSGTGDMTVIWDGEEFLYESTEGTPWWWDAGKLLWKYGRSPYRTLKLVQEMTEKFLRLYEPPYFPFRSLTERAYELDLVALTSLTGEQLFAQNKIDEGFSRALVQAATRVNYAANLACIHGLETMVSFATDGAISVDGGNWRIFDRMVRQSGAALYLNTSITSVSFAKEEAPGSPPKYAISAKSSAGESTSSSSAETFPTSFDDVIIASPWQFSDMEAGEGVIKHQIETVPYVKLHVTLFTSPYKLSPEFFKLAPGSKAPSNVYTTLAKGEEPKQGAEGVGRTGFYSISTLRTVIRPKTKRTEFAYKIFSPAAVTPEFLSAILGVDVPQTFLTATEDGEPSTDGVEPISWYYPHWFYSYPVELPRVTFQDPVIGNGLYYTSGIESFISTMETSALMGKNVARLIVDDLAGISRANASAATSADHLGRHEVKFEPGEKAVGEL